MLLELAVGDAYGAAFEYVDSGIVEAHNDGMHYHKHPRHEAPVGWYTDDTQMSLAIAEAIVSGDDWTPLMLANRFVEVFRRDPRTGYARGFHALLSRVGNGQELLNLILPDSDKSGAAMRAAPVGVYPTVSEVIQKTTVQARVTHDTPDGIRAACAAALMTHYFLYEHGPKADLGRFLEAHVVGTWAEPWHGKVKSKGWMSVQAACTAVMAHNCLSDLLRGCIAYTGDVDTVATIALAAGSCCREMQQDLPDNLVEQLENRAYGRDYILTLDKMLLAGVHEGSK